MSNIHYKVLEELDNGICPNCLAKGLKIVKENKRKCYECDYCPFKSRRLFELAVDNNQ